MPLTPSAQLLVDAGIRGMSPSARSAWAQWKESAGWTANRRSVGDLPPRIALIAEEALYHLQGALKGSLENGQMTELEELNISNDLDNVDVALSYLKSKAHAD